ncbi:MAG TPA: single-stranded-DNA-specific exonuclease RecJ [Phycisphaerae bacterium]|nr:single-stranded-DNA-specific exonuclease RecJ [Phycisphaerae bacterium]
MSNSTEAVGFKKRRWLLPCVVPDELNEHRLIQSLGCHPLIARLLLTRLINEPEQARAFLNPELRNISPPETLPGMDTAADLVVQAIKNGRRITIFGDYDVDGITGTAMLWHLFTAAGATFDIYIPHRVQEGYGMSLAAIQQIAQRGTQLLLSVDCGITAIEPVAAARAAGMDVVITDHHEHGAQLPDAQAIVHPRLNGGSCANPDLCGAGVAFKLCWAIAVRLCKSAKLTDRYRNLLLDFLALAALATIADVAPLTGENRILVKNGLAILPRCSFPGIQALLCAAGWKNRKIDGMAVGFSLAPRLNAAGRMDHAGMAVDLLTTDDSAKAARIAEYLEEQNRLRQTTEREITASALETLNAMSSLPSAIVLCESGWHAGVVGIVASRVVDAFYRPVFVLTHDGEVAAGSGRSVSGFPLHEAIDHCRDLLISGGGHAAAGGVRLNLKNLAAFRDRLCTLAARMTPPEGFTPAIELDGILESADIDLGAFEQLEKFAPFGFGNPRPKFLLKNARIGAPPRRMGSEGSHLQLQIHAGDRVTRAVGFRMGVLQPSLRVGMHVDLVVEPVVDRYNGRSKPEVHLVDLARSDAQTLDCVAAAVA